MKHLTDIIKGAAATVLGAVAIWFLLGLVAKKEDCNCKNHEA